MAVPVTAEAGRRERFRELLRSRRTFWRLFLSITAAFFAGGLLHDWRIFGAGAVLAVVLIVWDARRSAALGATRAFFRELAPTLGLTFVGGEASLPYVPLLSAGLWRTITNTMEGPLYGSAGGPRCVAGHYTYEARTDYGDEPDQARTKWHFTVVAADMRLPRTAFAVYLRPRLSALGLDNDWLRDRTPSVPVELESETFNQIYELRRGPDQSELRLRELFSPTLVAWLTDHPLHPGFELVGGAFAVFVRGREESAAHITLLHDAARELSRRALQSRRSFERQLHAERPLIYPGRYRR